MNTLYRPELLYSNGKFIVNGEVLVNESGQFSEAPQKIEPASTRVVRSSGKGTSPGLRECSFSFVSTAHSRQIGVENR